MELENDSHDDLDNSQDTEESTNDTGGAPDNDSGESLESKAESDGGESSPESPLYDGMTGEALHSSYKEMQAEYTRSQQSMKDFESKFDSYGGLDTHLQNMEALIKNPRFLEWAEGEKRVNDYGLNDSEMTDDSRDALSLVERVAEQKARAIVEQVLQETVNPMADAHKEAAISAHLDVMDEQYDGWRDVQDDMKALSLQLPPEIQNNPSLADIKTLYFMALDKSGKFDDYAAKKHEQKIAAKKSKSMDKPGAIPASDAKNSGSIAEAFAAAKQAHGSG